MKKWKPKEGERVWYVNVTRYWIGIVDFIFFKDAGFANIFPTKNSAELALRKIQRILGVK